jgi:hypothetical protein
MLLKTQEYGKSFLKCKKYHKTKKVMYLSKHHLFSDYVGMAGFEPAASTSQMWRDTGLRYIPKGNAKVTFKIIAANIF